MPADMTRYRKDKWSTMHLKRGKLLIGIFALVGFLFISSCTGSGAVARGWSGAALGDTTLYVGTMTGKLAAINLSSRNRQWADYQLEGPKSSGSFGCASAPAEVAVYGTPVLSKDLVYAGGYDGKIYAVDVSNGQLRWVYPRQDYIQPVVGGLTQAGGKLFFGDSSGVIYALDAATGNELWRFPTGDKVWSTPVVNSDTLYVASFDKKVYALNIADGKPKWQPFATSGAIVATPIVSDGVVYVGSFDRYVYAINSLDGSRKWQSGAQAGNWFWADPVLDNNTVYAPSLDGKVYAFKADDGSLVTTIDIGDQVSSSPVVINKGTIVLATKQGKVLSIDTSSNVKKELADVKQGVKDALNAPLAVQNGVIYLHTDKDTIYAIDSQTGTVLWTLPLQT